MRSKISLLIIIVFILAFNVSSAYADVIEPGKKEIKLSYQISNINNFPMYVFLLHGSPSPPYEILNTSEFSFYKLSTGSIYAVKRSVFNTNILNQNNQSAVEDYFNNNSNIIHSNLELEGSYGNVDTDNQLNGALIVLEIVAVNDSALEMKKSKIIFNFTDGSTQEKTFEADNITPFPSKTNVTTIYYLWYFVLPLMSAIAIIGIFLYRRRGES